MNRLPGILRSKIAVNRHTGCWEWTAFRDRYGYGQYGTSLLSPGKQRTYRAHRLVYEILVGEILAPSLDHLCRVRHCVNPDHLEPASMRTNTLRGNTIVARNAAKTHCPSGHELAGDNLIPSKLALGRRGCRACNREMCRAWRAAGNGRRRG